MKSQSYNLNNNIKFMHILIIWYQYSWFSIYYGLISTTVIINNVYILNSTF